MQMQIGKKNFSIVVNDLLFQFCFHIRRCTADEVTEGHEVHQRTIDDDDINADAQQLVKRGRLDDYYKIRPQTQHSSAEARPHVEPAEHGLAKPTSANIGRPLTAVPTSGNVPASADVPARKTADVGIQVGNGEGNFKWYKVLEKVREQLDNINTVLSLGRVSLSSLVNCRNKVQICIKNTDLCSEHCSGPLHFNLIDVGTIIDTITSKLDEKVECAAIQFQRGIDAIAPFVAERDIPTAMLTAARMLVDQYDDYCRLTGSSDKEATVKQLQALLQGAMKRKPTADMQETQPKKTKK